MVEEAVSKSLGTNEAKYLLHGAQPEKQRLDLRRRCMDKQAHTLNYVYFER